MDVIILILLVLSLALSGYLILKLSGMQKDRDDTAQTLSQLQNTVVQLKEQSSENRRAMEQQSARLEEKIAAAGDRTQQAVVSTVGTLGQSITGNLQTLSGSLGDHVKAMSGEMKSSLSAMNTAVSQNQAAMNAVVEKQMQAMEQRLTHLDQMNEQKLEALRGAMLSSLQDMRQENTKKLDEIRGTVDEKLQDTLQKKITESFQTVSQQLEQVYKGLGEMQHLASDVGGLKQVLSGVKTRGILGEIQLGAILEEILSPEQYDTNVATIPGSRERVEFAVKLPGESGGQVYLPIDSKFPGDAYMHLQDAQAAGDPAAVAEAQKALTAVLKKSAKDIRDKYVEPPYTTTFGILFLPFEGLYAQVVNMGMIEVLQREYSINVAGPSTMAALLNSLQMGFRTLAIQKRSNEVWTVLGAVKTEFEKFETVMTKMQGHLRQTSDDLEKLMGVRTRAINRKLQQVQQLEEPEAESMLELED